MKFNVIIGNPPYQTMDAGESTGASPIYNKFVDLGKKLNPDKFSLIIPSRWMSGGKNLDKFRNEMLKDSRISHIVDYHDASDCFPGVSIEGGVCYFLWDKNYNGLCNLKTILSGKVLDNLPRKLDEFPVLVRFNLGLQILHKVRAYDNCSEKSFKAQVSSLKPYGLRTFFKDYLDTPFNDCVKIYVKSNIVGYIKEEQIIKNHAWKNDYSVLVSRAYGASGQYPRQVLGKPIVSEPNSICTETYLVCGHFKTQFEAESLASYMKTKFFRFMVSLCKISQDNPKDKFMFVPDISYDKIYTDEILFEKYGLTDDEQEFIKMVIKS